MHTIMTLFATRFIRRHFRSFVTFLAARNERRIARLERRLARLTKDRQTAGEIFTLLDELDELCEGTR